MKCLLKNFRYFLLVSAIIFLGACNNSDVSISGNVYRGDRGGGSAPTWSQVSAGYIGGIGIRSDGSVWAWGSNPFGENGDRGTIDSGTPARVCASHNGSSCTTYLTGVSKVARGTNTSYALLNDGRVLAWGKNHVGQLGDGTGVDNNVPTPVCEDYTTTCVTELSNVASIVSADKHMMAIKQDGTLWGVGYNLYGQIGAGTGDALFARNIPAPVGGTTWVQVVVGNNHTLGLLSDGSLWAWGYNVFGQLGQGDTINQATPVQIAGTWRSIGAGPNLSFGISSTGNLWGWGYNVIYALGAASTDICSAQDCALAPVQVGTATDWVQVDGGSTFGLARKSNGTLWVWGSALYGGLGLGDTTNMVCNTTNSEENCQPTPVQLGTATDWTNISVKRDSILAMRGGNTLWSWGGNVYGQLGQGTVGKSTVPRKVLDSGTIMGTGNHTFFVQNTGGQLLGAGWNPRGGLGNNSAVVQGSFVPFGSQTGWSRVGAGSQFTVALKNDGSLWASGHNGFGQLGDGTDVLKLSPIQVGSGTTWLDVASSNSTVYALNSSGQLYGWGDASYNALGSLTGTACTSLGQSLNCVFTPTLVHDGTTIGPFTRVASGAFTAFVRNGSNQMFALGYGGAGNLGNGGTANSTTLVPVNNGRSNTYSQVISRYHHVLAIDASDGSLWAWGSNSDGQIGDGTTINVSSPYNVMPGSTFTAIGSGKFHSLAVRSDGTLWAWGLNSNYQLGNGTTTSSLTPIQVGSDTDWVAVDGVQYNSFAMKSNGSIWAWGANGNGPFGDGSNIITAPTQVP